MKHEIDMKKHSVRTDLISEIIEEYKDENGIVSRVSNFHGIKVTDIKIKKEGSKLINKKIGNYITLEFDDVTDQDNKKLILKVFIKYLKKIMALNKIKKDYSCLIIGLGNSKSTPDSLGPLTIDKVLVTNYLYSVNELDTSFRPVSAIIPGVTGTTGIETSDMIKGVVDVLKPDFLITIDALASKSIERLNTTIQMCDTGIDPGSGIGNTRKEISKEIFNIPVISIGVPTVVDAVTIVTDTIDYLSKQYVFNKKFLKSNVSKLVSPLNVNYLKHEITVNQADREEILGLVGKLSNDEVKQLIYEVLTPIDYNLMITPKEIDFVIEKLSEVLADGINISLHDGYKK